MTKHPYGRLATIKFGLLDIAQGVACVLTLGEYQPRLTLSLAIKEARKAHRSKR